MQCKEGELWDLSVFFQWAPGGPKSWNASAQSRTVGQTSKTRVRGLLHSVREKAEWLQKMIELELQQSDPSEIRNVSKVPRACVMLPSLRIFH